jgi:spore coat polysaccharide biosynthesis protein SpsF
VKTVVIVQARMTSTRLPGKVLLPIVGKPMLELLVERLRRVRLADSLLIATTVNAADEPIVQLCRRLGVACSRGSEHDVLARYYEAALAQQAAVVVRVTSDCPLLDPALVDEAIAMYRGGQFDYVTNGLSRSYPVGMSAEVFSFGLLEQAWREAKAAPEREHVTPFIYGRAERYRIGQMACAHDLSAQRWTVDTPEDFDLVRRIFEALYPGTPEFGMADILDLIRRNPDWSLINAAIVQKTLGE